MLFAGSKKPRIKKYEINQDGILERGGVLNISFKNIENYNIDKDNLKILINTKNKFQPLISIPFEKTQNIYRIDKFLASKIKKDEKLKMSISELFLTKLLGM